MWTPPCRSAILALKMMFPAKLRQASRALALAVLLAFPALSGVGPRAGGSRPAGSKTYTNSSYGISFQYPGNFGLREGKLPRDDTGLGYLGRIPMGFQEPGGVRVATLENPDAYPGTPYVNSFFTVSVNRFEAQDECGHFQLGPPYRGVTPITISGIRFAGVEGGGAAGGHSLESDYYHGFSSGICYELGYGVATAGWVTPVSGLHAFPPEVFEFLKKILISTRIRPPREPARSPVIRSFSAVPLGKPFKPFTYRVSWDVKRAGAGQVFLTTTWSDPRAEFPFSYFCFGRTVVDVFKVKPNLKNGKPFGCDVILPLGATKGSMNLALWNRTGSEAVEGLRLFAQGTTPAVQSVHITLPSLPVIWSVDTRPLSPHAASRVYAGQAALLYGRFHGDETAWVGATQAQVESRGHREMWFVVPALPPGRYVLRVANERGRSNAAPLDVLTTREPRIVFINGTSALPGPYIPSIYLGGTVVVRGVNFAKGNAVRIGSSVLTAKGSSRGTIRFTAPLSLLSSDALAQMRFNMRHRTPGIHPGIGKYLYITNKYGKSNRVYVVIRMRQ